MYKAFSVYVSIYIFYFCGTVLSSSSVHLSDISFFSIFLPFCFVNLTISPYLNILPQESYVAFKVLLG